MSGDAGLAVFTAEFRIKAVDRTGPDGLYRVPPVGANSHVVFDVSALHGPDASSSITQDNRNIAMLNDVIAAWTQQFSHASNHLINDLVAHDDRHRPEPPHGGGGSPSCG